MKKYVKSAIKTDIFEKASRQAAINDTYLHLRKLAESLESMNNEDFDSMGLSQLYKEVIDKIQVVYPHAKH